jgi:hypothetical protein
MKNFIATLIAMFVLVSVLPKAQAEGIMQRVCHEKNGKQVCKNIKIHKKVDGVTIPTKPVKKKK